MSLDVVKQIKVYLNEPQSDYAVMLEGRWGCGKTFFLKNRLPKELEGEFNRPIIYISLFGLESVEEIYETIAINILNIKVNQDAIQKLEMLNPSYKDKRKNIFSSLSNGTYKISKVINEVTSCIPYGRKVKTIATAISSNSVDYSKYLFVFDDFERTTISKTIVLGCFDNLVEQYHAKVIVVCYEKGIEISNENCQGDYQSSKLTQSKDDTDKNIRCSISDNDISYSVYKEKVFGLTITYKCNLEKVFDELASELVIDSDALTFLKEEKCNVLKWFKIIKSSNVRTLKFILKRYVELYSIIKKQFTDKIELFESFMALVLQNIAVTSLRIKEMSEKNVYKEDAIEYYIDIAQRGNVKKKDSFQHLENYVKVYKAIDVYLQTFYMDEELLKKHIENVIYNDKHNIDKIKNKVSSALYKNESEAREILQSVKKDIYNDKIDINAYSWIIDSIYLLSEILGENEDIEKLKSAIFRNADLKYKEFKSMYWNQFPSENRDAKKIKDELYDFLTKKRIESSLQNLKNIFNCDENFLEKILYYMNSHHSISNINHAIFYNIEPKAFVDRIISLKNIEDIYKFRINLTSTYLNIVNIKDFYKNDYDFFHSVSDLLKKKLEEDKDNIDKILLYHLNCLNREIAKIAETLA